MKAQSLVLLLFSSSVYCTTYYVSPNGDNTSGLSPASAFHSLHQASDAVVAGDSVIVLTGTYAGFYHTISGTASQRIVFSVPPGEDVLINAPNATTNDGINLEGASYVTVEGFKVYGVPRAGLRSVLNEGVEFKNNNADSCGKWGILTGFSEKILIEGNECSRSVDEHGIYVSNSADNPIIQYNICWGNNAAGIHMNGDVSLPPGDGIINNALVRGNIIFENGNAGGSGINCDGVQNSRIENNLLYDNHASGISLYQIDGGDASKNNVVVNNTIVQPSVTRWALNISDGSTGNTAFNNIFYSDHSFRGSISIDAASFTGFKSDYNIVTERMSNDGGNSNMTLAQWQQTTQLDEHSIVAAPVELFVNIFADDYHLLSTSPAVDFGISTYNSTNAPATDLDFNTRIQGSSVDAGAYELKVFNGILQPQPRMDWSELSPEDEVHLFELSGKLIFIGKKNTADEQMKLLGTGFYLYRTVNAGGWLKIWN